MEDGLGRSEGGEGLMGPGCLGSLCDNTVQAAEAKHSLTIPHVLHRPGCRGTQLRVAEGEDRGVNIHSPHTDSPFFWKSGQNRYPRCVRQVGARRLFAKDGTDSKQTELNPGC